MDHPTLFILLACLFGLLMTWGVGANDLANVMSTAMGSKSIKPLQAIIIAIVFEFAGAFLAGGSVMSTVRSGIIDTNLLTQSPDILVFGMLAVLIAGTTWMTLASFLSMPVSITHTIIGSIIGFGCVLISPSAVQWSVVIPIAISWVSSPAIAGIFSYLLFMIVQQAVFAKPDPLASAKRCVPWFIFIIAFVLAFDAIARGIRHWSSITLGIPASIGLSVVIALITVLLSFRMIARVSISEQASRRFAFEAVEKVFAILMFFTACAMVFAHGSNDIANAVGPMAAIVTLVQQGYLDSQALPVWIIFLGCSGVIVGLLMYGRKVIETVGSSITALTPSRAFAATFAAAMTVVLSTSMGVPVSATQTLVGGVLGVGLAKGIGALNLKVVRNIFMSWFITVPAGAGLTILYATLLKLIFA